MPQKMKDSQKGMENILQSLRINAERTNFSRVSRECHHSTAVMPRRTKIPTEL